MAVCGQAFYPLLPPTQPFPTTHAPNEPFLQAEEKKKERKKEREVRTFTPIAHSKVDGKIIPYAYKLSEIKQQFRWLYITFKLLFCTFATRSVMKPSYYLISS